MLYVNKARWSELYDEFYNDDELFDEFVNEFIDKHPDEVFYIIGDWLAGALETNERIKDMWEEYVTETVDAHMEPDPDEVYDRMKEDKWERNS